MMVARLEVVGNLTQGKLFANSVIVLADAYRLAICASHEAEDQHQNRETDNDAPAAEFCCKHIRSHTPGPEPTRSCWYSRGGIDFVCRES